MKTVERDGNLFKFHGSNFLKQRLILSILSGKSIHIVDIRSEDDAPGLRGYEVSLIRLFDKISNGSDININKSGTAVMFKPGILHGGVFHHDCNLERGIGMFSKNNTKQNKNRIEHSQFLSRLLFGCFIGIGSIL